MHNPLEYAFPECRQNLERIEMLKRLRTKMVERIIHSDPNRKYATFNDVFDTNLFSNALARDMYEEKMEDAGGRGNAANVQGLLTIYRKKTVPVECELIAKPSEKEQTRISPKENVGTSPYQYLFTRTKFPTINQNSKGKDFQQNSGTISPAIKSRQDFDKKFPNNLSDETLFKKKHISIGAALPPSPKTPKFRDSMRFIGNQNEGRRSAANLFGAEELSRIRRKSSVLSITLKEDIPISPLMKSIAMNAPRLSPTPVLGRRRISMPFASLDGVMTAEEASLDKREIEYSTNGSVLHFTSPLSGHQRNILSQAPWRQTESQLDSHDKAVLAGMPYDGSYVIPNPSGIRTLGNVIVHSDLEGRKAALTAMGDRINYGNPTCLAYILPMFKHPNSQVRLSAIRSFSQVVKPGQDRQYCEIELQVWGCTDLPKTDRHGTCDPYVKSFLKDLESGEILKEERSHVVWNCLNPKWRKQYFWEVGDPLSQSLEFQIWDEDGQRDDLVGQCSFPLSRMPAKKNPGDEMPINLFSIQLLDKCNSEPILGYNEASADNTGKPCKLRIKLRYGVFLLPEDLMTNTQILLSDNNAEIRSEAIGVLMTLSGFGDRYALSLIAKMMEDQDQRVRSAAVRSLAEGTERNDSWTIRLVASRLQHDRKEVRHCALDVLSRIVDLNNDEVLSAVCDGLQHPSCQVRTLMCEVASILLSADDADVVETISQRFSDQNEDVREASLRVMAALLASGGAGSNGDAAVSILEGSLDDTSAACRCGAIQALCEVAKANRTRNATIVARVDRLLEWVVSSRQGMGDSVPFVRKTAANCLEKLRTPLKLWYDVELANEGEYSPVIEAKELRVTKEGGVSSIPQTEIPTDSRFLTVLPYRPPTPLWEPKAQERKRIQDGLASVREELEMAIQRMRALALVDGTEIERQQVSSLVASLTDQLTRLEKQECGLSDSEPAQPSNTTKLGFRIVEKTGGAHHCDSVTCGRCKFY